MADIDLGKIGITPKGTFNNNTTYEYLDLVKSGIAVYLSIHDNNNQPLNNTGYWMKLFDGGDILDYLVNNVINVVGLNVEGNLSVEGNITGNTINNIQQNFSNVSSSISTLNQSINNLGYYNGISKQGNNYVFTGRNISSYTLTIPQAPISTESYTFWGQTPSNQAVNGDMSNVGNIRMNPNTHIEGCDYIKIGEAYIVYDREKNALKVSGSANGYDDMDLYATGNVLGYVKEQI